MKIAFYKGQERLFNRFVSWWTRGPYSHCEAVFDGVRGLNGPVLCGSSSFMDGGVRTKMIVLTPEHWDIIDVPAIDGLRVLNWFAKHKRDRYDLLGLLSTSVPIVESKRRWFCNEAVGHAAGLSEAWRFNPNGFARIVELLPGSRWIQGGPPQASQRDESKPATAGFLLSEDFQ